MRISGTDQIMKVLFICENYFPHIGGAEVVFKNLAERYVQRGHQVTVLTSLLRNTLKQEIVNGVKIIRVRSFYSRYVFTFTSILKAIKLARKNDLIQTTSFNGAPPAWLAGKFTTRPVVITVHEVWVGKWKEVTGFSWLKSMLHELLERAIYLLPYDKYVCVSNATMKDLKKLKINEQKFATIYNGLDYDFWDKTKAKASPSRLKLPNKYLYLSWGRPGPTKGFEYLIKAFPIIKSAVANAHLLLMLGQAQNYEKKIKDLFRLIKELQLEDNITILISLTNEEKRDLIACCDCVIIPSTSEGFGYTTVEANALNIPVVASDAGSIPEIISGSHLIFKNKDIIDLAEKAILASNEQFAVAKKKVFDWNTSVVAYLKIYENMMNSKS